MFILYMPGISHRPESTLLGPHPWIAPCKIGLKRRLATARFGTTKAKTRRAKPRTAKPRKTKAVNRRLKNRFQKVLDAMSRKPSLKFPAGCNGRAEVDAAYRFLDNEHVTFLSILKPHAEASLERIREQTVVLIPQDTTELDLTRPHEVMVGERPAQ